MTDSYVRALAEQEADGVVGWLVLDGWATFSVIADYIERNL